MSGRLVGEVVEWLRTRPAADLTQAERIVLLVIAERASEQTREMWRHKGDSENLIERIAGAAGVSVKALGGVFGRLARRGLEVRIAIDEDRIGRPVFARSGHAVRFVLPDLPAAVALPETGIRSRDGGTFPVDNPSSEPVDNPPGDASQVPSSRDLNPIRSRHDGTKGEIRSRHDGTLVPLKTYPSKDSPSTPKVPVSQPDVEGALPVHREPSAGNHPRDGPTAEDGYAVARDVLARLPDFGNALIAAARTELGATAPLPRLVIHAAQAAHAALTSRPIIQGGRS